MGFFSQEETYQPLPTDEPKDEILVGEEESQPDLVSIVATPPCEHCQHKKDIDKKRFIIIVPSILQLIACFGWISLIAPLIGLVAIISKSKFFTILHFISAVLTYIIYSVSLSVATMSCFSTDIGFGIVFAITSVLFLFLFAITLRNYVTYCKVLVKKVGACTCDSEESIIEQTPENIMSYSVTSSIYPGQVQQQVQQPVQQQQQPNVQHPIQPIFMNGQYYIPVPINNFYPQQPMFVQPMYPQHPMFVQPQQQSKQ